MLILSLYIRKRFVPGNAFSVYGLNNSMNFLFCWSVSLYNLFPVKPTRCTLLLSIFTRVSLNNRECFTRNNFFFYKSTYRNCFCLTFRHSPPASQHNWSTCPQACECPMGKSFLAWPLTKFASPPLPRRHLQTSGPANIFSLVQTSESPMAPYWTFILP